MLALGIITAAGTVMAGAAAVIGALAELGILRRRPRRDEDSAASSEAAELTTKSGN